MLTIKNTRSIPEDIPFLAEALELDDYKTARKIIMDLFEEDVGLILLQHWALKFGHSHERPSYRAAAMRTLLYHPFEAFTWSQKAYVYRAVQDEDKGHVRALGVLTGLQNGAFDKEKARILFDALNPSTLEADVREDYQYFGLDNWFAQA